MNLAFLTTLFLLSFSCNFVKTRGRLTSGGGIECRYDAYNCPSYRGPYGHKRLGSCEDVRRVFEVCSGDPHGLDADGDGIPCEKSCSYLF